MELRSGFKQTDIGQIPEDWGVTTVAHIAASVRNALVGGPFGSDLVSADYVESGVPVIRGQNIGGRIVSGEFAFVTEAKAESLESNLARRDDLIFTQRGTLGQVSLVPVGAFDRYLVSQSQMKLTVDHSFADPVFFYYVFASSTQQQFIRKNTIQTGVPHINLSILRKIPIQIPSLEEQRAIAGALSDVDDLIDALKKLIAKKRRVRQGVMQKLLTGRNRLTGFDEEWQVRTIGELFHVSGGVSASRSQLGTDGYCYLHYGDIHTSNKSVINIPLEFAHLPKLDTSLSKVSPSSLLMDGDIVFVDASEDSEGASKHIVVVNPENIPFISGLHTIVAKAKADDLDPLYRRYCFRTSEVQDQFQFYVVGTKVCGISKSNIRKIRLLLPTQREQQAIAAILDEMDGEIDSLEMKLTKTQWVKVGMEQELLTGRTRLVQHKSNVVGFRAVEKAKSKPSKGHNSAINEAVIISVLAKKFGSENYPLGRKRYTKLSYLLHRHEEGRVEGYLEKAAGPYNPSTKYKGAEKIALSNRYVRAHARDNFSGFVAAEKIAEAEGYFTKWYGDDSVSWLEQFRYKKNDELELLATVDMAMENLQKAGKQADLASVKQYLHDAPEWTAKLSRTIFADENIDMAIRWSRQLFESSNQ